MAISIAVSLAACDDDRTQLEKQLATVTAGHGADILSADTPTAGVTPFISFVTLRGSALATANTFNFTITPLSGAFSKPVSVNYSLAYLTRRGYAAAGSNVITIPIFGLYAGLTNAVTINLGFTGGEAYALPVSITTAAYADPYGVYDHATILTARSSSTAPGFDYLYMKSDYGSPVVIDTDGQVRWIGPIVTYTTSSYFNDGGFIMGSNTTPDIYRLEMDGTYAQTGSLSSASVVSFTHDIGPGKTALLDNENTYFDGVYQYDSTAREFDAAGNTLATWDMAAIISAAMTAGGDDPSLFVRPGLDWFHLNSAIYDPSDDSVILSSRENFVIKVDYATGAIRWILGDTTKYWYTFASLRAKALTLSGDGLVPIGQHALSIANDGSLMLFNDGHGSDNEPAGTSAGLERTYSAVSDYVIDESTMTAQEAWHFDYNQSILSEYCSSAKQVADGSILIDYAIANGGSTTRIVGLDKNRAVAFDFQFPNSNCFTAWNSQPMSLDSLQYN